jgi:hypothetical protein
MSLIDFEGINQAAVRDYRRFLQEILPGGYLSDMVNLTRAKDAAIYLATNLSFANGTN